jgi:hypothetical protein
MGCGSDLLSLESYSPSTIGAEKLNCCVRDGNRCGLLANTTTDHWLEACEGARKSDIARGYMFRCKSERCEAGLKPHGRLVSLGSTRCRAYTCDLSTS